MATGARKREPNEPRRGLGLPFRRGDGGQENRTPAPGWRIDPGPDGRGKPEQKPGRPRIRPRLLLLILAGFLLNLWIGSTIPDQPPRAQIPYSPRFLDEVEAGNVQEISSTGDAIQGELRKEIALPDDADERTRRFETQLPTFVDNDRLEDLLRDKNVVINAEPPDEGRSLLSSILLYFGPTLLFIALIVFLARRAGAGGGMMSFGRSRARRYDASERRVSFEDVAGIDEAEDELTEIVDFLKNPDRYARLGGRIPRGVLLSGPPGTGKTLLARAVAGEAGVPFFSMSASEFIEMIVGVGASRVRDLFSQAKSAAPAIIFIDELDAIGRARGGGSGNFGGGGADEREQTLNQILTEMDGFDPSSGVIVLAATNRPDVLDAALLRPGRFDRRVAVQPPDKNGRRKILEVHTRKVPLAPDVTLESLAATTPGKVGADLANLVNEAAQLATRRNHEQVQQDDFTDALEKILLGAERKILMGAGDRRRTAYHEAGHALVGMLTPGADPVRKVSIIPRGMALGVTFAAPDADRFNYDEDYLLGKIKVMLGGRVAEEVVFGDITTGAESDIQQLTQIARQMVGRWGMSPQIGPVAVLPSEGRGMLLPGVSETSERTQQVVDDEVRRIVDESHVEVRRLLERHRDKLEALSEALLAEETLDEPEAYAAAGLARPVPEVLEDQPGQVIAPPLEAPTG